MKRIGIFLLVAVLLCTVVLAAACNNTKEKADELVVYNWADYIYSEDLEDFKVYYKQLTGREIKVTYVTFDTNETMLTKILNGDSLVDVMCPSEYAIQKLLAQDFLLPMNYFGDAADYLDASQLNGYVHNSENVDANFVQKVDEVFGEVAVQTADGTTKTARMSDYFVPYMYGTLGILYNKVYFQEIGLFTDDGQHNRQVMNDANWGLLFNKTSDGQMLSEGLTNRIYMKDSIRDSYAATVFFMLEQGILDGKRVSDPNNPYNGTLYTDLPIGELINTVDDQLVELCSQTLKEQKTQLYGYEVDFGKNELVQGIAYVDLAWSGDALYAVEESWSDDYIDPMLDYEEGESGGYTLGYYVPHTSGNIWFDGWVIPKTCPQEHLTAAKIFINYLNELYVAASNITEIGYTAAVSPDKLREGCQSADSQARAVLAESFMVFDGSWDLVDEDGNALTAEDCSFASWEEFEEYFFDYCDPIDDSNWRYPFVILQNNEYNRKIDDLGVMRDFGANNGKVSTMWEDVRSTGITVWALLGWTVLAVGVAVGVIGLVVLISRRKKMYVVVKKAE